MTRKGFKNLAAIFWSLVVLAQGVIAMEVYTDTNWDTGARIGMWSIYIALWLFAGLGCYAWWYSIRDEKGHD